MRILATVDGSNESRAVLPALTTLAKEAKAEVTLLCVTSPAEGTTRRTPGVSDVTPGVSAAAVAVPLMRTEAILQPAAPAWAESKDQAVERVDREAREWLRDFSRPLRDAGLTVHEEVVMSPDAADAIVAFAKERHFDLITMATHGRSGLREVVQGSVAGAVVRSGVAPVMLVRPRPAG